MRTGAERIPTHRFVKTTAWGDVARFTQMADATEHVCLLTIDGKPVTDRSG